MVRTFSQLAYRRLFGSGVSSAPVEFGSDPAHRSFSWHRDIQGSNHPPGRLQILISKLYWNAYTLWHARREARLPYLPLAEIEAMRDRRFREMMGHACQTVAFYRHLLDDLRLVPGDFQRADDLSKLPVITGQDLAGHPYDFLSSRYSEDQTLELSTTGTTGQFKRIFFDPAALFQARAAGLRKRQVMLRLLGQSGSYRELSVARAGGTWPVIRSFYRGRSWTPRKLDLYRASISPADSFAKNIEVINGFRPDVVVGFGAYIGAVFRFASENGLEIFAPRVVHYGGDTLHLPEKRLLEEDYGITVLSSYQACEALNIAFQCERRQGFHISLDQVAVRVVDGQGRDVPAGTSGDLLISNLTNRATVLLNYRLGDKVTLATEPCLCGRTLPLIETLDGRAEDLILRPGGELAHESVILSHLYDAPGLLLLQLEQLALQEFVLRVVSRSEVEWSETERYLDSTLRSVLGSGDDLSVTIERVDDIPCEPSGKFQAIRSACKV